MNKNNKIVAELLKNSGLKQVEFAERIGVSRSHLSMIVAGTGNASDKLAELALLKFSKGDGNTASPIDSEKGREAEMEILKDKLILQMELCQKLQADITERDNIISSLKDELLGKRSPLEKKA